MRLLYNLTASQPLAVGLICTATWILLLQNQISTSLCDPEADQFVPTPKFFDQQQQQQQQQTFQGLLSPFRSTYQYARNLINLPARAEAIHDRFSRMQAQAFRVFMRIYNKTYSAAEIPRRMRLFFDRRKQIEESIKAYASGRLTFMMRENPYIDWEEHELKGLTGVSPPKSVDEMTTEERSLVIGDPQVKRGLPEHYVLTETDPSTSDSRGPSWLPMVSRAKSARSSSNGGANIDGDGLNLTVGAVVSIPTSRDWRKSGCIGAPVNQEKCGCCYAIATMGVLESMRCLRQVASPTLSPQQVVDCSTPARGYQNFGCDGGWPTRVLHYLRDVGVAAREACYPLVLRQGACKLNLVKRAPGCTVSSSITDTTIKYKVLNNEKDILYHVAKTGPVVTVMRATDKFLYYGSGIFDDPECSRRANDVDHAIAIVGYGKENGIDYWLIKNSWGKEWGQNGYGKFKRGTNACSIGHWGWVILG